MVTLSLAFPSDGKRMITPPHSSIIARISLPLAPMMELWSLCGIITTTSLMLAWKYTARLIDTSFEGPVQVENRHQDEKAGRNVYCITDNFCPTKCLPFSGRFHFQTHLKFPPSKRAKICPQFLELKMMWQKFPPVYQYCVHSVQYIPEHTKDWKVWKRVFQHIYC